MQELLEFTKAKTVQGVGCIPAHTWESDVQQPISRESFQRVIYNNVAVEIAELHKGRAFRSTINYNQKRHFCSPACDERLLRNCLPNRHCWFELYY